MSILDRTIVNIFNLLYLFTSKIQTFKSLSIESNLDITCNVLGGFL
jgi:hypothetical protein